MDDNEKYKYSAHTHAKLYNCNINKRQYNETIARVMDNYDLNFGIIGKDGDFFDGHYKYILIDSTMRLA